ncbi:hypothetical protein [Xylanibacter muris]|uniref:FAS1 domain-containing protein n=1 Tax=Xylanibacter muris TaxID=2736290 RepID=A0ABX2ARY3_9BACT|nr:hypothetical protein [Xylanibacter muris]NPD92980.1 hypothetical protein [Xylanibacter muris]
MKINNIIYQLTGLALIACPLALAGCSDWDDHYEGAESEAGTGKSLWSQMKADGRLTDFCEVLENTKVFRQHKKTPVSYAELLDGGQAFTVVAPVNNTFNKDSLINLTQTNTGDSLVENTFVMNHVSRSLSSVMPAESRMRLLNSKHVSIESDGIAGVGLYESNIHAKNGILHVSKRPLPFVRNLYEYVCDIEGFSGIGAFLRSYDEDYFDADASVSGGIVDGVPVYVDSVVYKRNKMLDRIGRINEEDSTYWMVVPSSEGWDKAWNNASKYYRYDKKVLKADSIQRYWTNRALLDDAIFSMTTNESVNDSLKSVQYIKDEPEYHVFYKPFEPGGILSSAVPEECSNGILYKTTEWPFTPEETFFTELRSEGENQSLITANKDCNYTNRRLSADSISEGGYIDIVALKTTSNWTMTYRVNNTLSAKYDICAILLPKSVADNVKPDLRPCKFKATINYVDTLGNKKTFNCGNKQFISDPLKVDTIVLAENFEFPACNYDQQDIKISVQLTCSILARENSQYNREMYLDCIYLRPRTSKSEE